MSGFCTYQCLNKQFLAIFLLLNLAACGGGGGDGNPGTNPSSGETIVFTADKETDGVQELYAMHEDGSGLRKLSGPLIRGGSVSFFKQSPDRGKVAYSADQDTDGKIELYVVNIDGSNRTKVSSGLGANGDVNTPDAFWWSPDSTRLVYLADADIDGVHELYLVNSDGSDHHKINGSVGSPPVVQIGQAEWSPDGRYVAYYVRTLNPYYSGFAVDRIAINTHDTIIGQPNSVRVSGTLPANQPYWVNSMVWSPDSTRIAYTSYENTPRLRELYIAIAGQTTQQTRVNVPLNSGQGVLFRTYWSDDSRYLLYSVTGAATGNGLYTHDSQNSTPRNGIKISGNVVSGGNCYNFAWSPDNSRIAYIADQDTDGQDELFSALPDVADSAMKISGQLPAGSDVHRFVWSPDNSRIAYLADQDVAGVDELYTVTPSGLGNIKVSAALHPQQEDVSSSMLAWSPHSMRLAYEVRSNGRKLFVTGADSAQFAREISGGMFNASNYTLATRQTTDEYFTAMPWNRAGSALIYSGIADPTALQRRLYRAEVANAQSDNITGALVTGGSVSSFDY